MVKVSLGPTTKSTGSILTWVLLAVVALTLRIPTWITIKVSRQMMSRLSLDIVAIRS
jgi:hypothetical protein